MNAIVFDDTLWGLAVAQGKGLIDKPIEIYIDKHDRVVIRFVKGTKVGKYYSWLEEKKAIFHHGRFVDPDRTVLEVIWNCPKGVAVLFKLTFGGEA